MKSFKAFLGISIACLLFGCGASDNISKDTKERKEDTAQIKENVMEIALEPVTCDAELAGIEDNFFISAVHQEGKILLFDTAAEKELACLDGSYDSGSLFLSMSDKDHGALLYCSPPACGLMAKQIYVTKDRWQTYDQMDISGLIDGYPTSLSARSDAHLYIGAQMRSDGYLFETIDGGKTWAPVIIDDSIETCRYGSAPISHDGTGISYVLLECNGPYLLYKSDAAHPSWEQMGTFSPELEIRSYFIWNDNVIVTDTEGRQYRLSSSQR